MVKKDLESHGIAADDCKSMAETECLLRSPANAGRLMAAIEEMRRGRSLIIKSFDELPVLGDEVDLR